MDERIRAAERSGDRRRLLVEQHRAGLKIDYQVGDIVRVVRYPDCDWVTQDLRREDLLKIEVEIVETEDKNWHAFPLRVKVPGGQTLLMHWIEVEPA